MARAPRSGSSSRSPRPTTPAPPASVSHPAVAPVAETLRTVGLVVFALLAAGFFFTQLPNNPEWTRLDIWLNLPDLLLLNLPGKETAKESGWQFFPQRFDLLAVAMGIWLAAWGAGRLILRGVKLFPALSPYERNLWGCGVGIGLLSLATLALGAFGILNQWLFAVGLLAVLAAEVVLTIRSRTPRSAGGSLLEARFFGDSKLPLFIGLAVAPFLMAMLLGAMLPSTDFDVREYHFEGPKEYYQGGRIRFLPHNIYTSFPFFTEMLHLLGMILRGDWYRGAIIGQTVLMGFAPLTAAGLFYAGRRWFSERVAWLAVLAWLTTPWAYRISTISYTEGALAAYVLLSAIAVLRAGEEWQASKATGRRWFLLSGFLAGCGPACKYPGAISVAIPMFLMAAWTVLVSPVLSRRGSPAESEPTNDPPRVDLLAMVLFLGGGAVAFAPWLIKNLIETGNPFYPLMYGLLGGRDLDPVLHAKWKAGHPLPLGHMGGPIGFVKDQVLRFADVFLWNDWQTPLALASLPLGAALLALWRTGLVRPLVTSDPQSGRGGQFTPTTLLALLLLYVVWLFEGWCLLTHRLDRFWVPMLPIACWIAGIVLDALIGTAANGASPRGLLLRGATVTVLLGAMTLYHLGFVTSVLAGNNSFLLDERLAQKRFRTPSIAILEDLPLPPKARVLFVGEAEVFEAHFDYVYNTVFDHCIFEDWFAAGSPDGPAADRPMKPPDEVQAILKENGITHVAVNWSGILRYRPTYGYTDFVHPRRFQTLVEQGVLRRLPRVGSLRELERIPADQRQEVERWAPDLVQMYDGKATIPGVLVYEVLP